MKNPFLLLSLPRQKKDPDDSPTWLIVSFVVFLLASTTRFLKFGMTQDVDMDVAFDQSSTVSAIVNNLIFLFTIAFMYKQRHKLKPVLKVLFPLLLLYAWAFASTIWSEFPIFSFKRVLKSFILVALIIDAWLTSSPLLTLRKAIVLYAWVCSIVSIVLIVFFPKYGWNNYDGGYLPCGVFFQKNGFGVFACTMLLSIVWLLKMPPPIGFKKIGLQHKILFSLLVFELIISRAMTAAGALSISVIIVSSLLLISKIINKKVFISFCICSMISIVFLCILLFQNDGFLQMVSNVLSLGNKDLTFTGRTEIWKNLIGLQQHPLVGTGYGVFFLSLEQHVGVLSVFGWVVPHAHNGYLQVYLELGLVGIFLVLNVLIVTGTRAIKMFKINPWSASFCLGILILDVFFNMFEVGFLGTSLMFVSLTYVSGVREQGRDNNEKLLNV